MKRLIEQTACEHGKFEEHVTMQGQSAPRCPGGSSREVTLTEEKATAHWSALTAEERSAMPPNIHRFVTDWEPLVGVPEKESNE